MPTSNQQTPTLFSLVINLTSPQGLPRYHFAEPQINGDPEVYAHAISVLEQIIYQVAPLELKMIVIPFLQTAGSPGAV